MRDGGKFSTKSEGDPTQGAEWVQGSEGRGYINLGGKVGAAVGRDRTQATIPGVTGRA